MRTALFTSCLLVAAACSKTPQATGPADTASPDEPPAQEQALAASTPPECETRLDCPKNLACIGPEGCDAAWSCQEPRPCTRDLVPFCGCDGKTFHASSTCPPRKYSSRGPCGPGDRVAPQPTPCTSSADCPQGETCQGPEGCTEPWSCQPSRPCTRDRRPFCGCDGETFTSSSTCPARPYAHRGKCK